MTRRGRSVPALVAIVLMGGLSSAPTAAATTTCHEPHSSPADAGVQDNWITDIAHLSACNVWEVGQWSDGPGPKADQPYVAHGLAEHWNGAAWHQVPVPQVGAPDNNVFLRGVSAVKPYDMWAVGRVNDNVHDATLAMHWDGHGWTHVVTPSPGAEATLAAVAVHTHDDAWAVGTWTGASRRGGLVERWNGQRWTVQSKTTNAELADVVTARGGRSWAVGNITSHHERHGLVLHWTGKRWKRQATSLLPAGTDLVSVAASGRHNVWAVGQADGDAHDLALHFHGNRWHRVRVPSLDADSNVLDAVSVDAKDGAVWAAADDEINGVGYAHVFVRRNGAWSDVACLPDQPSRLLSIEAARRGKAVAAGFLIDGTDSHLLSRTCA